MLPKISVITVVKNAESTLERAICSVIDQQYENIEYLLLDGGSTDNTVNIIKKYQASINYWHSKQDGSACVAVNQGIELASGDIIAFLFADDWYEPNTLQKIGQTFLDNPSLDMVTCGYRVQSQSKIFSECVDPRQLEFNVENICFGTPSICTRFIRTSVYRKQGVFIPFDKTGKKLVGNDREFLFRLASGQLKNKCINHIGYNYFVHPGSTTFSHHVPTIKRIYAEHLEMAEQYLVEDALSKSDKKILKKWYCDQSVRLFLRELIGGNFVNAKAVIQTGIKKGGLGWFKQFFFTGLNILKVT